MNLEESGFAGIFDLTNPEWQTDTYKAYRLGVSSFNTQTGMMSSPNDTMGGIVILPLTDQQPIFPNRVGDLFHGAYLIGHNEKRKHNCQQFKIEYVNNEGCYPYIAITFE